MASHPSQARVFSFTRAGNPVFEPVKFLSLSAAALSTVPDGATFITRRSENGLQHLFVTDDSPSQEGVAYQIAQAMHAHMEELDEAPDLTAAEEFTKLKWTRRSMFGVSNMAGADVSTIAELLGGFLMEDEWVAMSVRHPSKAEAKWNSSWARALSGGVTHQSMQSHSTVVSVYAGTNGGRSEAAVQSFAGALPGFSIRANNERVSGVRMNRNLILAGVGAATLAVVGNQLLGPVIPFVSSWWPAPLVLGLGSALYGLGAAGVVPGLLLPGRWKQVRRQFSWGRAPMPERRWVKPKQPTAARQNPDGTVEAAREGEYPLRDDAFLVSGHYPCLLINPHAGAFSASSGQTSDRPVPDCLKDPGVGIELGMSGTDYAFLSWVDMWAGVFIAGIPGSGKTALLEWIWGETCRSIASGAMITPIAFDTKGDGEAARQMVAWGVEHGQQVGQFHVADTSAGFGIDLFPRVGPIAQQASRIVDAFVYLYGDQSVGLRSQDTLKRVFHAALTLTPELVTQSGVAQFGVNPHGSPFHFANVLLGGLGEAAGKQLAEHVNVTAVDTEDPLLLDSRAQLMPLYGSEVTPSKRRDTVEAPRNKVAALLAMEHWWSAPKKVSWRTILESHQPVVINTGVTPSGEQPSDQRITTEMAALVLFSLKRAIVESCAGWQAQRKAVRIFADEVKSIASSSPEVITWFRDDGRAFGVEPVFATQYLSQLIPEVKKVVLTFGTLIAFRQGDEGTAKEIASDLSLDGSTWELQDVTMLAKYSAIVRSVFQQDRLPAFTMLVPHFQERRRTVPLWEQQKSLPAPEAAASEDWYLAGSQQETSPTSHIVRPLIAGQTDGWDASESEAEIADGPGIEGW